MTMLTRRFGEQAMTGTAEKTYMTALYETAESDGKQKVKDILCQLKEIDKLFSEYPDYPRMLASPLVTGGEKLGCIDEAFVGKADEYIVNFLKVLCDNNRIGIFSGIVEEYEKKYNSDNGILKITAVTAFEPDEDLLEKLKNKLEKVSGKTVSLESRVDGGILGGIMLKVGSNQLDATVRSQLDELKAKLEGGLA